MNVVRNYDHLVDLLKFKFKYGKQGDNNSRVAGLLFAQPNSFTKDEILSGIDYFNNRSEKFIDFFCVGYQPAFFQPNYPKLTTVGGCDWSFNPKIFNELRRQTEERSNWKYSGSVELVLFNSYLDKTTDTVKLDFSDSIAIDLKQAKENKLISSVGELFERIFSISEKISTDNPAKEMSLKLIGDTGKKSIVNILFNLLPKAIQDDSKKIYLFGTENYDKKPSH
jgi:hypothetical protein